MNDFTMTLLFSGGIFFLILFVSVYWILGVLQTILTEMKSTKEELIDLRGQLLEELISKTEIQDPENVMNKKGKYNPHEIKGKLDEFFGLDTFDNAKETVTELDFLDTKK